MPALGDRVTYHLIPAHACDGRDCDCAQTQMKTYPAIVIYVHSDGHLALEVELDDDAKALGYTTTQSYAPPVDPSTPQSGGWT